jgi:hypothetical protein
MTGLKGDEDEVPETICRENMKSLGMVLGAIESA